MAKEVRNATADKVNPGEIVKRTLEPILKEIAVVKESNTNTQRSYLEI